MFNTVKRVESSLLLDLDVFLIAAGVRGNRILNGGLLFVVNIFCHKRSPALAVDHLDHHRSLPCCCNVEKTLERTPSIVGEKGQQSKWPTGNDNKTFYKAAVFNTYRYYGSSTNRRFYWQYGSQCNSSPSISKAKAISFAIFCYSWFNHMFGLCSLCLLIFISHICSKTSLTILDWQLWTITVRLLHRVSEVPSFNQRCFRRVSAFIAIEIYLLYTTSENATVPLG